MENIYEYYLNDSSNRDTGVSSNKPDRLLFTVTLVDDDPLFMEQMMDYLKSMRITEIESYKTGEDLLTHLKESDRRLIICDYDFGSVNLMNGLHVLEAVKVKNPDVPVIMLSSQDSMSVALQVLRSGASDYFIKGMENTFTSILTSIIKINELERLKKNERDYQRIITAGSAIAVIVIAFLAWELLS
jgi:DNA-binding NarL/FixJ family response regulator